LEGGFLHPEGDLATIAKETIRKTGTGRRGGKLMRGGRRKGVSTSRPLQKKRSAEGSMSRFVRGQKKPKPLWRVSYSGDLEKTPKGRCQRVNPRLCGSGFPRRGRRNAADITRPPKTRQGERHEVRPKGNFKKIHLQPPQGENSKRKLRDRLGASKSHHEAKGGKRSLEQRLKGKNHYRQNRHCQLGIFHAKRWR